MTIVGEPGAATGSTTVRPFRVEVPDRDLEDLRRRLADTRWPAAETTSGEWDQGVPLAWLRQLCDYWRDGYDWRRCEARLNAVPQFLTEIDGVDIHFLHVRSPHPAARPLVLTHGWPGSVLEFLDVAGRLADPVGEGGDPADAFHVVCPSLPGYGFSGKPSATGWNQERIADAWVALMGRLGYGRFFAQGGDWGAFVSSTLARRHPDRVIGIHLNLVIVPPTPDVGDYTDEEKEAVRSAEQHLRTGRGYSEVQSTRPQTLGYALVDSPAGQCAWIAEKFHAWTDHGGDPFSAVDRDRLLDDVTLYWLTGSAVSSARLYWESAQSIESSGIYRQAAPIPIPIGVSIFPRELVRPSRRWCERFFPDLRFYERAARGGHFAALEQPDLFVDHVRRALRIDA